MDGIGIGMAPSEFMCFDGDRVRKRRESVEMFVVMR